MKTLETIQKLLFQLEDSDLEELAQRIQALRQFRNPEVDPADYLLDGMIAEAGRRGLGPTVPPNFRLKSHKSFRSYISVSKRMRAMLEENCPGMNELEKGVAGRFCARILGEYLEEKRYVSVTFFSLLEHIGSLPEAIDDGFPGYLANRSFGFLIKSLMRGGRDESDV